MRVGDGVELEDNRKILLVKAVVGLAVVVVTASESVNSKYLGLTELSSNVSTVPLEFAGRPPIPALSVNLMDLLLSNCSGRISYRGD